MFPSVGVGKGGGEHEHELSHYRLFTTSQYCAYQSRRRFSIGCRLDVKLPLLTELRLRYLSHVAGFPSARRCSTAENKERKNIPAWNSFRAERHARPAHYARDIPEDKEKILRVIDGKTARQFSALRVEAMGELMHMYRSPLALPRLSTCTIEWFQLLSVVDACPRITDVQYRSNLILIGPFKYRTVFDGNTGPTTEGKLQECKLLNNPEVKQPFIPRNSTARVSKMASLSSEIWEPHNQCLVTHSSYGWRTNRGNFAADNSHSDRRSVPKLQQAPTTLLHWSIHNLDFVLNNAAPWHASTMLPYAYLRMFVQCIALRKLLGTNKKTLSHNRHWRRPVSDDVGRSSMIIEVKDKPPYYQFIFVVWGHSEKTQILVRPRRRHMLNMPAARSVIEPRSIVRSFVRWNVFVHGRRRRDRNHHALKTPLRRSIVLGRTGLPHFMTAHSAGNSLLMGLSAQREHPIEREFFSLRLEQQFTARSFTIMARRLSYIELENVLSATSDDEEIASESEDHISGISDSSSEEETGTIGVSYLSKDGSIQYSSEPPLRRRAAKDVLKLTPGPTKYATSQITDECSAFLFIILINSNVEGVRVYGDECKTINSVERGAYIGVRLLAGVFKSCNESTERLWDAAKGRPIYRASMILQRFFQISSILRFDSRETRSSRKQNYKFATIRDLWDILVETVPKCLNPSEFVTIDEQLVAFRGNCPFRQYMPSKPAKYGLKFWVLCDNETSYIWNIQPYTGKQPNQPSEKNHGLRVVLYLSFGLKGHNITFDNFFMSYKLGQMFLKKMKNKLSIATELLNTKNKEVFLSTFAFTNNTTSCLCHMFLKKLMCCCSKFISLR
ncbi:hypothetical protein PR048_012345 [Dryococelus australis]|uniref:PiggyBac transposable element-derived protein domain-containing protein n=1 Tax=Dryococelus australis TaxID=614101 RepID=A0ABQ9HP90_9NEOP|nr:hypothetical protein PR048_012345 [Dryococelus australis]